MNRTFNKFLLFCCAIMPGAGYMYLGLMRRGVEAMILFIAGLAIPNWLQMEELAAIIAIPLWFYCFFDTFYSFKTLNGGVEVEDTGIINMISWVTGNYHLVGIGLMALGLIALFNNMSQDMYISGNVIVREAAEHLKSYLPPLLLIALGLYILRRSKKANQEFADSKPNNDFNIENAAILDIEPVVPEVSADGEEEKS